MMTATLYFWNETIGTVKLVGDYDPCHTVEMMDCYTAFPATKKIPTIESVRPMFRAPDSYPDWAETLASTDKMSLGAYGLLWRTESGRIVDMIPVVVETVSVAPINDLEDPRQIVVRFRSSGRYVAKLPVEPIPSSMRQA